MFDFADGERPDDAMGWTLLAGQLILPIASLAGGIGAMVNAGYFGARSLVDFAQAVAYARLDLEGYVQVPGRPASTEPWCTVNQNVSFPVAP